MKISAISPVLRAAAPLAVACLTLALSGPVHAQRLPSTVFPEHYTLTLTPDLKAATFTGVEAIDIDIKQPSASITLNAAEIKFQSVTILQGEQQTARVTLDDNQEQATFTFPHELHAGTARLDIRYTGILNDQLRGFYLSKGDNRNYAVTQFEPTDARRAFPSFDEPAYKATYAVKLVIDSGDTAISNGPIVSDTPGPGDGKHTLQFLTTPKMSSYLVAFLVGDFKCSSGDSDGVAIRVCATPDKVSLTPYALDVAKYVLHYYNTYFGIPYPLKKLDLIAIPDFEAGAMENFGAITYRETDLLLNPDTATIGARENVALVVAHEMAHQWFGDLVTMEWWDNIWLNEGFATWMENKAVAAMHPEWGVPLSVASEEDGTLNLDAMPTTRAIRANASTPAEINQLFDGIAYGKASDVLLTVENYLGPETFRKGVHSYLEAHLYGNATAQDFWNAETEASHKPVDKIMDSLVAQPGVPLLTFGDPGNGQVSVDQSRFFLSPSVKPNTREKWTLPVCFAVSSANQDCEILTPNETTLRVPFGATFFANARGKGYYRSAYPPDVFSRLVEQVESSLTPAERISLIGDEWAQVRSDKSSIGSFLDLVAAVKADANADVVDSALSGVATAYDRIAASPEEKSALAAWVRSTFGPEYDRLGKPGSSDSPNTRELRAHLFGVLGYFGNDPDVLREAHEIAEKYVADPASVDPTLGQTALAVAARNGDATLFDQLLKIYQTSKNPEFQIGALRLLAEFEDPTLARRTLELAVSGKVRNQDAAIEFAIEIEIPRNRDQAWKFVQDNWDKVHAQLTTNMGGILVGSTGSFCSESARDSVQSFFTAHSVAASDVSLKHALEQINGCIELRSLQEPKLKSWLESRTQGGASTSSGK